VEYRERVTVMPPEGTCALNLLETRLGEVDRINFQSLIITYPGVTTPPGYPPGAAVQYFGNGTIFTA
jgi:hypothetical protein